MKRLLYICLLLPVFAMAASYTGSFTAPMERVDGSVMSLSEIAGFDLFMNDIKIQDVDSTATSYFVDPIPEGVHTLYLITRDTGGRISVPSTSVIANVSTPVVIPADPKPVSAHTGYITY